MNEKLKSSETDELFKAVMLLGTLEECYDFFEDLCTVSEIKAMSQRLVVAKMLSRNVPYHEIESKTGASSATISRVSKSLHYGSGGYICMIEKQKYYSSS